MQETAAMPEERKAATLEDVWAVIREIGEKHKEIAEQMEKSKAEHDQWLKKNREEYDRKFEKHRQEYQQWLKEYREENDRKFEEHRQENDRKFEEHRQEYQQWLKEQWNKTNKKIGDLTLRFGDIIEHLIAPNLTEKFKAMNFGFTTAGPNRKFYDSNNQELAEVDILLENTTTVMAVEVKSKLLASHVQDHLERMDILRAYADEHNDRRIWIGAVGGALLATDARKAALKAGFYLLEQSGDTVKIAVPEDFKPREWTFHTP
jgi:F0F1-type ATP synthase membrane subunit b/b'